MHHQSERLYENTIDLKDISYDIGRDFIGSGGFGIVYSAKHSIIGDVALKTISNNGQNIASKYYTALKNEISFLVDLCHPNIIIFYGMVWEKECCAIVLEYMALGDLDTFLHEEKPVHNILKTRFICDVVQGIHYLHSQKTKIIHNDLKITNVLVTDALIAKISDFGLAQWRIASSEILTRKRNNNRSSGATITHLSPEKWKNFNLEDTKCDVYSCAILMWEIYTEQRPFSKIARDPELVKLAVLDKQRPDKNLLPNDLPPQLHELIESCWHQYPDQRPKIVAVLNVLQSLLDDMNLCAELRIQTAILFKKIYNKREEILQNNFQGTSTQYRVTTGSVNATSSVESVQYDDLIGNPSNISEGRIHSYLSLQERNVNNGTNDYAGLLQVNRRTHPNDNLRAYEQVTFVINSRKFIN